MDSKHSPATVGISSEIGVKLIDRWKLRWLICAALLAVLIVYSTGFGKLFVWYALLFLSDSRITAVPDSLDCIQSMGV